MTAVFVIDSPIEAAASAEMRKKIRSFIRSNCKNNYLLVRVVHEIDHIKIILPRDPTFFRSRRPSARTRRCNYNFRKTSFRRNVLFFTFSPSYAHNENVFSKIDFVHSAQVVFALHDVYNVLYCGGDHNNIILQYIRSIFRLRRERVYYYISYLPVQLRSRVENVPTPLHVNIV